jgi:ankyrin repeat protein
MPNEADTSQPNLEYYRKQAKSLLRAAISGDPDALERFARYRPKPTETGDAQHAKPLALHEAQLTIAREQGFSSWPGFRTFIVQSALNFQGLVNAFIDAAVSDLRRAEEMLSAHPNLADAGFYAALVLGARKRVESVLTDIPAIVGGKSGPQNCEPLLYVCFSRFANGKSSRAGDLAQTARILLRHGADPNACFVPEDSPGDSLSCLYAATGLNNNPALALALLEAGASPNDSESLYHSTEHRDLACMKLLLSHGADPTGTNALKHMLDREDPEGLRLLLAARANPNEVNQRGETALHWAVGRGRSAQAITALLDRGVDLDAKRSDGRTAHALSIVSGQSEIAALLAERGAKTDLSALDRFVGAYAYSASNEPGRLPVLARNGITSAGSEHLLPDLTSNHRTSAVRALLAAGMPVDARGEMGATALHWACWKGYADLVKLLLDHGASLEIEDEQFQGTPPGWFGHGVHNCGEGEGNYAEVARLLIAAHAKIPAMDLPTGSSDVDAVLREHGLIA